MHHTPEPTTVLKIVQLSLISPLEPSLPPSTTSSTVILKLAEWNPHCLPGHVQHVQHAQFAHMSLAI